LAAPLKDKDYLGTGAAITFHRTREKLLPTLFFQQEALIYCRVIEGLLLKMGVSQ